MALGLAAGDFWGFCGGKHPGLNQNLTWDVKKVCQNSDDRDGLPFEEKHDAIE
jgi:hypothetical protein